MNNKTFYPDLIKRCQQCKEIDLAAYLVTHEGFVVSSKSSRRNPVLKDPLNGFHYLIKQNPIRQSEYQAYITENVLPDGSTNFNRKHISLIDYMMQKHHLSLGEAVEKIETNTGIIKPLPEYKRQATSSQLSTPSNTTKTFDSLKPFFNYEYLCNIRKLNNNIINEPFIKNSLRSLPVGNYTNTVFPMKNREGEIKNWCEKNAIRVSNDAFKSWQSFPEASTSGLLYLSEKTPNPEFLVFSETPIDAISYYQLNHDLLKDKCLLISSCGNINPGMLNHLEDICLHYPSAKLIIANDFDAAGLRFDFMIAASRSGTLTGPDAIKPFFHPIQPATPAAASGEIRSNNSFNCSFLATNENKLNELRISLARLSCDKLLNLQFSSIDQKFVDDKVHFTFSVNFQNSLRTSKILLEHFCELHNLKDTILFDKPDRALKDFNEMVKTGKQHEQEKLKLFMSDTNADKFSLLNENTEKKKTLKP